VKKGGYLYETQEGLLVSQTPNVDGVRRGLLVPCLAIDKVPADRQSTCASLIDPARTDYFIRAYGDILQIEPEFDPRNPETFDEDASFYLVADEYFPGYYTEEPVNRPGERWVASGDRVRISEVMNSREFRNAASFAIFDFSVSRMFTLSRTSHVDLWLRGDHFVGKLSAIGQPTSQLNPPSIRGR